MTAISMGTLDIFELSKIVNNNATSLADKVTASTLLRQKSLTQMNGTGWLLAANADKESVRKALKYGHHDGGNVA